MKLSFIIALICCVSYHVVLGQEEWPFQARWEPLPWTDIPDDVESCYGIEFRGRRSQHRRGRVLSYSKSTFDQFGRDVQYLHTDMPHKLEIPYKTWEYSENGCFIYPGSPLDSMNRSYGSIDRDVFLHCDNGWVDSICDLPWRIIVRKADTLGRLKEYRIYLKDSIDHLEQYEYDSLGRVISIDGTRKAQVVYSADGREVTIYSYYPRWKEYSCMHYFLNERGLLIRVEEGGSCKGKKWPRPFITIFYEWKMRGD